VPSAPTDVGCKTCSDHNPELVALPNSQDGSVLGYTFQVRCRRGDFTATAAGDMVSAVRNWEQGV